MKTLETRIASIEERISPAPETPCIVYVVYETNSLEEQERIKLKAVSKYELENGVKVVAENVSYVCITIVYGQRGVTSSELA